MSTPTPDSSIYPIWQIQDVLGWLIERNSAQFDCIATHGDLWAATLYNNRARNNDNPARWSVGREEKLVALYDQDSRRYAKRGTKRIRVGLRAAGTEQDLRRLLRAGRITVRGYTDGGNGVEPVRAAMRRAPPNPTAR